MDYDDIVKGRRRNWDELKPEEIRQREKEQERERKDKETKEKGNRNLGYFERRQKKVEEDRERDMAQYRQTVRLIAIGAGALAFVIVVVFTTSTILRMRTMSAYIAQVSEYDVAVLSGERIRDYSDPVNAFASWRGAWIDLDPEAILESYSRTYLDLLEPSGNYEILKARYSSLVKGGGLANTQEIAVNFTNPELFRIPSRPWREGMLALFRSQPFERANPAAHQESVFRYIVAFSYDASTESWRFADMREEIYFSVRWDFEGQIRPLRGPAQAIRYDSSGRPIDR